MPERCQIAERHRDEDIWRGLDQLAHQPELDGRIHRHVEQEQGQLAVLVSGLRGRLEQRRAIGGRCGGELVLESFEQPREIRTAERQGLQGGGPDAGQQQLVQGAGEGTRKARRAGHRSKVSELFISTGFERGARRHRFAADERHRRNPPRRQDRRRQPCRELRQAEAMQTDRPAARGRDGAGQVVGRTTRGRDDQDTRPVRARGDPGAGFGQARRGVRGFDETQ